MIIYVFKKLIHKFTKFNKSSVTIPYFTMTALVFNKFL